MVKLEDVIVDRNEPFDAVNERLYALGLTDGLPVVPPAANRVDVMLGGRDPSLRVAVLPPLMSEATLYRIAFCAVMAGCLPQYLSLLIAAVQAVAEENFNLLGIQTTTGTAAPAMIVNGPITERLGFNAGANALGPGIRSNATVGRALSLILRNVGGAIPGEMDMSTMGQPGKYTFCFAENEPASPWEPFHVSRGFDRSQSTVTVVGAAGTLEVKDEFSTQAADLLTTFAHAILGAGGSVSSNGLIGGGFPVLLLAPSHAHIVARGMTRESAQTFLFETARLPLSALSRENRIHLEKLRLVHVQGGGAAELRVAESPRDILLIVVGGTGLKSTYVPTWGGGSRAVTKPIKYS
jgi:hypothetical protein